MHAFYVHVLISHTTQWKFPISIFILLLLLCDLATILLVLLIQVPCVKNNENFSQSGQFLESLE